MLEIGKWIAVSVLGNSPGEGSPMVVVRLEHWFPDHVLLAASHQLPSKEVTFAVTDGDTLTLRWFGPEGEVPFCGHGALAASAVLTDSNDTCNVEALGGSGHLRLVIGRDRGIPMLQMPKLNITEKALGHIDIGLPAVQTFDAGRDYLVVLPNATQLRAARPDRAKILALDKIGIILTARAVTANAVFRFFAPRAGIEEDRVSCSVLPALAALWIKDGMERGMFIQCSDVEIPMSIQRIDDGWRVTGKVYPSFQGAWSDLNTETSQCF